MQRIILSLALITFTIGGLAFGATSAFFNDTEQSAANAFTAGDIDLKIDNESYYNGLFNKGTSWLEDNLDGNDYKFFNFGDLKPGDYGEDTISIHVDTNDAYLCANVTLTSNNENTCNEPEALEDVTCGTTTTDVGAGLGELANLVEFVWWADDGDNVLEDDEDVISEGTLGALEVGDTYPLTLADSNTNIWNALDAGGPVEGNQTYYIGKAWCFGDIGLQPVEQDGETDEMSPAGDNAGTGASGEPEDGGITCNGEALANESQTDSLTADISFSAVQSRHNPKYICEKPEPRATRLTLVKQVINDDLGNAQPNAWTLVADGPTDISGFSGSSTVTSAVVLPGTYTLGETGGPLGYDASQFSCVVNGGAPVSGNSVTLAEGDVAVCTITNNDREPVACSAQRSYADTVVTWDQGVRKNNTAILPDRTDPLDVLGVQQSTGAPFDNPVVAGSFFSLGFDEATDSTPAEGGWVVLAFNDNYIVDGPGNDIRAWEVTGGTSYPVEKLKVEVSQDGSTWYTANPSLLRDEEADMSNTPIDWARYVRLTDVSTRSQFEDTADGYDLDAVSALNCQFVPEVI